MTHSSGAVGGQPLDHPQQQLEQPPLAGARDLATAGHAAVSPPQARSGSSRPSSWRAGPATASSSAGVQLVGQAAQRLDDRRERQALLAQRHTTTAQHPHPLLVGGGGQLVDQAGLADPGLPADQRHQRLAVGGTRQQLAQPRQLLGAADEPAGRDLVGHAAQYAPPVLRRVGRGLRTLAADLRTLDTAGCRCRPGRSPVGSPAGGSR